MAQIQVLDAEVFRDLMDIGSISVMEQLAPDLKAEAEQKRHFLSGKITAPHFTYPKKDVERLKRVGEQLMFFDLHRYDLPISLRTAYARELERRMTVLSLLTTNDPQVFLQETKKLHGEPSHEEFYGLLQVIHSQLEEAKSEDEKRAAYQLRRILPGSKPGKHPLGVDPEVVMDVKHILEQPDMFGPLLRIFPDREHPYMAEELREGFQEGVHLMGAYGYEVEITTGRFFHVRHVSKLLRVPQHVSFTGLEARKKLLHEVGWHIGRRMKAYHGPLHLLQSGLSGYELGEEGITVMSEQAIAGKYASKAGYINYLAIGFVLGLDGLKRDFPLLYPILKAIYCWKFVREGMPYREAEEEAANVAYDRGKRFFKGCSGQEPVCFTKDLVYYRGAQRIWQALSCMTSQERAKALRQWRVGKYDPVNPEHTQLLQDLLILR